MTPAELARIHPRLFHVTLSEAWDQIRRWGLWSAVELVRHLPPEEQRRLIAARRTARVPVDHPRFGRVWLSDNAPIHLGRLAQCLDDELTPADWLRMLNARVFFWRGRVRAEKLAHAASNRGHRMAILQFDTARLVAAHLPRVEITPINTGNTARKNVRRGLGTFTPIAGLRYIDWQRARPTSVTVGLDRIAEIAVRDGVPDIAEYFLECETVTP